QDVGERDAAHAQGAGLQEVAARDAVTGLSATSPGCDGQHGRAPVREAMRTSSSFRRARLSSGKFSSSHSVGGDAGPNPTPPLRREGLPTPSLLPLPFQGRGWGGLGSSTDPSPTPPLRREGLRTTDRSGSPFLSREGGWGVRSAPLGSSCP